VAVFRACLVVAALVVSAACSADGSGGASSDPADATTDGADATTPASGPTAPPPPSIAAPMQLTGDEPPTPPEVTPAPGTSLLGPVLVEPDEPTDLVFRPTDGQPFVLERAGTVRMIVDGALSDPVLDLRDSVVAELEWGLLGMTFAGDGEHVYLNETDGFETRIHEFPVAADGTFAVDAGRVVYRFDQPAEGHNGGDLLIGPDGYLYVFNGDGGGDRDDEELGGAWNSDIYRQALSLDSPLGKILRIDPSPTEGAEFGVPADNPFVDVDGALPEIWSVGVRNPWRNGFDPATGDLWVADVGNFDWEEISRAVAGPDGTGAARGLSFGWSAWEGFHRANEDQPAAGHLLPVYEYPHGDLGCSVVGGTVYRGDRYPELDGRYLFGDHCSGAVWAMEVRTDGGIGDVTTVATLPFLVDIAIGPDGAIFVTSVVDGIHELVPSG
jgi:glucose/arabinose dehydrogenase